MNHCVRDGPRYNGREEVVVLRSLTDAEGESKSGKGLPTQAAWWGYSPGPVPRLPDELLAPVQCSYAWNQGFTHRFAFSLDILFSKREA